MYTVSAYTVSAYLASNLNCLMDLFSVFARRILVFFNLSSDVRM